MFYASADLSVRELLGVCSRGDVACVCFILFYRQFYVRTNSHRLAGIS